MKNLEKTFNDAAKDYIERVNNCFNQNIFYDIEILSKEILKVWKSENNIFIDSFKFNQLESNKNWIDHKDLRNGGVIDFEMSNTPNLDWGSAINSVPFSMTKIK